VVGASPPPRSFEINGEACPNSITGLKAKAPLYPGFCSYNSTRTVRFLPASEAVKLVAAKGKTLTVPKSAARASGGRPSGGRYARCAHVRVCARPRERGEVLASDGGLFPCDW
jgi:hypothetical protein